MEALIYFIESRAIEDRNISSQGSTQVRNVNSVRGGTMQDTAFERRSEGILERVFAMVTEL